MKYRLKKDIPRYSAGTEFRITKNGHLATGDTVVYHKNELKVSPCILRDWFEKIQEEPKTVYDLKIGDTCWVKRATSSALYTTPLRPEQEVWRGDEYQTSLREVGGIYLTEEECKRQLAWEKAKQVLLRDTKWYKPNKYNDYEYYEVYHDPLCDSEYHIDKNHGLNGAEVCFATRKDAEASIKAHPDEWETYLGVDE